MPKLILQPLVENAIYHGMSTIREGGQIAISARKTDGKTLLITVSDNGGGMSEETLRDLNEYIRGENNHFKGIRLKNVNRRIQLFCGSEYGITITGTKGEGTCVNVRIYAGEA